MSDLDRELEKALSDSEDQAREDAKRRVDVPPIVQDDAPPRVNSSSKQNWGLLLGLLAVGGGILALVFTSAENAAIYSVGTDQLLADTAKYEGRTLRVQGGLVKGSLRHRAEPCEYRFDMEKGGKKLAVRYAECVVPDTFKDVPDIDVEVTAEGKLTPEGYFSASQIMAKCPSKYEMQQKAARGEAAPHAQMGEAGPAIPPIVD